MNIKRDLLVLVSIILMLAMLLPPVATADTPGMMMPCRFRATVQADGTWVPDNTTVTAWITGSAATWIGYTFTPVPPDPYAGQSVCVIDIPPDDPQTTIKDGGLDGDVVHFMVRGNGVDHPVLATAIWELGMFVPPVNLPPLNLTVAAGELVATLSGQPTGPTGWVNYNWANITVGGDGVTKYKYYLDTGGFGTTEYPVSQHIVLSGLTEDWHTLYVIGGNDTAWQSENSPTTAGWGVDMTAPPVPTLLSPVGGARISDTTPTFDWTPVSDPRGVTYWLQIDDNADFSSPVLNETGLTLAQYTLPDANALDLGGYHWRVKAVDGAGNESDWSAAEFFIVETVVETPLLVSPPDGTITNINITTFDWSCNETDGVSYTLEIGNSTFSNIDKQSIGNITVLTYTLTTPLPDGKYYWHVKTVKGGDESGWSDAWSLTIDTIPPTATIIGAPSGTVPYNTANITVDGPDVVAYKYELDTGNWSAEAPVSTNITLSGLSEGNHTLYVIGRDTAGNWQLETNATTASWRVETPEPVATLSGQPVGIVSYNFAFIDVDGQDEYGQEVVSFKCKIDNGTWSDETEAGPDAIMLSQLPDGLHTVSVIGKNDAGNWQTVAHATTVNWTVDTKAPPAPTLVMPADKTKTKVNTVALDWSNVTDPSGVTYQVQVDTESSFALPIPINVEGLTTSAYNISALADGTYYWRVKAWDGAVPPNKGNWSAVWSFTVDAVAPQAPTLLSPTDKAKISDKTPELKWSNVTDPSGVSYRLQVDDNSDFSSPEVEVSGITGSSYTVPDTKSLAAKTYYWRVKAVDGAGNESNWTAPWSFTVSAANAWWWIILMAVVLAAALVTVLLIMQRRRRRKPV